LVFSIVSVKRDNYIATILHDVDGNEIKVSTDAFISIITFDWLKVCVVCTATVLL
jgi:membrane-associated PAP2 superfamily phosphatase